MNGITQNKNTSLKTRFGQFGSRLTFIVQYPAVLAFFIIFFLLCVFYAHVLFFNKVALHPNVFPSEAARITSVKAAGEPLFPGWNPYRNGGQPDSKSRDAVASLNPVDYYFKQFLRVCGLPPFLFIIVNYMLLAVTLYFFLGLLQVKLAVRLYAGLCAVFIPQIVAFLCSGKMEIFLAVVLIPLIATLLVRLLDGKNPLVMIALALVLAFQIARGNVQILLYTALLLLVYFCGWTLTHTINKESWRHIGGAGAMLLGSIVLGVLLSSVIALPAYETYTNFTTGKIPEINDAGLYSYAPDELITLIAPSFFGLGEQGYWGPADSAMQPLYCGTVIIFFALLALVLRRNRVTMFLAGFGLFSLFFSFGHFLPLLFKPIYIIFPFFDTFSAPRIVFIFTNLIVIVLAALGLESILDFSTRQKIKIAQRYRYVQVYTSVFIAVFMLLFAGLLLFRDSYISLIAQSGHTTSAETRDVTYVRALLDSFFTLLLALCTGLMVLLYLRKRIGAGLFAGTICLLTVIDLWVVAANIPAPQSEEQRKRYYAKNEAIAFVQQDPELCRIYSYPTAAGHAPYSYFKLHDILAEGGHQLRHYKKFVDTFELDAALYRHVPPVFSKLWRFVPREGNAVLRPVRPMDVDPELEKIETTMLSMLNVKYVLSHDNLLYDGFEKVLDASPNVFLNRNYLPRAFFVDSVTVVTDLDSCLRLINNAGFEPSRLAILDRSPPSAVEHADSNSVTLLSYETHEIVLKAEVRSPALLVTSEIYYPGSWRGYVDGAETPIFRTNYLLRSVFLEPGLHTITFVYEPRFFKLGKLLSLCAYALVTVLAGVLALRPLIVRSGVAPLP